MLLKIPLAARRPPRRQLHRFPRPCSIRRILRALIERHNDGGAEANMRLQRALRAKEMRGAIQMRAKRHAFFADFTQFVEAENLKSARVGKNRPPPRHKPMEPAELTHRRDARSQIEVVGIAKNNLRAQFLKDVLRYTLHRSQRADGHKHWSFDGTVRREQASKPGAAGGFLNLQLR